MCGCKKHGNKNAVCTCICPEHGNFQAAYDLAMSRYDEIRQLRAELEKAACRPLIPVDQDGVWLVEGSTMTLTDATAHHAVVDLTERMDPIGRAALVARLHAIADVIDRQAPCETGGVR